MTLREVFHQAKRGGLPEAYLYLPAGVEWTLETEGTLLEPGEEEEDADGLPLVAKRRNLCEALDTETIQQAVDWADQLAGREDDAARLEIFRYYFRFDSFPDRLGAPDPPPLDEIQRKRDREFYEALGPERADTKCRHEGCERGATRFSVFCRVHQFEQVRKRPCPFQD